MNVVYYLTNKNNGKRYIGSSANIKHRLYVHRNLLEKGKHHCIPLQQDFKNWDDFEITIVVLNDREEAFELEEQLISELHKIEPGLYNVGLNAKGGDNLTLNPNRDDIIARTSRTMRETRARMSEDDRRLKWGKFGDTNGMFGKTHSVEAREKISLNNKGRIPPNKGMPMSPEQHAKIMDYVKTRDYYGEKNPFYGKKHNSKTIEKMRLTNKGIVPANAREVSINGVLYRSMYEANRALNVPVPTILWRANSKNPKFKDWFFNDLNAQRLSKPCSKE